MPPHKEETLRVIQEDSCGAPQPGDPAPPSSLCLYSWTSPVTPLPSQPLPPSLFNLLTPCSQALKFMVIQTAPPQLPSLAASSQCAPPSLFNVGIVNPALPLKLPPLPSKQHVLITPPYGTFTLFFLPLSTKAQGLLCCFCSVPQGSHHSCL